MSVDVIIVDEVRRETLYEKVWETLTQIAETAAPGSITPETFARVSVDVVLTELLRRGQSPLRTGDTGE